MHPRHKILALIILVLAFSALSFRITTGDLPLIFEKNLHGHDEASNSVVSANLTRKFFPPTVRVNPLVAEQGNWMEGPYWQHIPPIFAYVSYPFYAIDGEISIEGKRLSFAFLLMLAGIAFLVIVYLYSKSLLALIAAFLAAVFWIQNPFSRELVTGYAFGVSDIVLAFSTVLAFGGLLWYFQDEKNQRAEYPWWKLSTVAILVTLPIISKNLLGAIPAAIFFIFILSDFGILARRFWIAVISFMAILTANYLPLYWASPATFKNEILLPFLHLQNLEGWGRPWHYYVSNYLPNRYLFAWTWPYFLGLIFGTGYLFFGQMERNRKLLLALSGGWFFWNLIAISLVESKIPNFIFQSYLLSIFFIIFSLLLFVKPILMKLPSAALPRILPAILAGAVLLVSLSGFNLGKSFFEFRNLPYAYDTEFEKFYQAAGELRELGLGTNDLVIVGVSENDCWFRYPILFLTGAEAKTLLEMNFRPDLYENIADKYRRTFFLIRKTDPVPFETLEFDRIELVNYSLVRTDSALANQALAALVAKRQTEILAEIERIKDDKTSCQWLVPDPILNAD